VADDTCDGLKAGEPERLPCPSEILDALANARDTAEGMKDFLRGLQPQHIDDGRSGQLSPPHSPSRRR
jgi:hypothetical protein